MKAFIGTILSTSLLLMTIAVPLQAQEKDVERLVAAMAGDTPIVADLQQLCDEIGGRPTGSPANLQAVEWAMQKFPDAGVTARKEAFTMPRLWLERSTAAVISGDVTYEASVVAMTFSVGTPKEGTTAPLVDGGHGAKEDFARLGDAARGAFILISTDVLLDIDGLFAEYINAVAIEKHAFAAGATGVVYMSSRPQGLLYRHNASLGHDNKHPMLVMEREAAKRALRLLRSGKKLDLTAKIDVQDGGEYESYNVIGEIPGSGLADEFVVMGAHLDSFGLGTGANDNGCNVSMLIDIARQMKRLGIQPRRTIRFILWNGEEQGLNGSWRYTQQHADELDGHVMAGSIDIGSGRITGFFTNGRADLLAPVEQVLAPVSKLGPFTQINEPVVGTDNYDFMVQGVANVVANHEPFNYGPNYHAVSDTYDKVDTQQLRRNAAVVAAFTLGVANMEVNWKRQTRAEVQQLVDNTSLRAQMDMFYLQGGWLDGSRGRAAE